MEVIEKKESFCERPCYKNTAVFGWRNSDNDEFFNHITPEVYESFLAGSGLNQYADIDAIESYINNSKSIVELGSGFGRSIHRIKQINNSAQILGIEKAKQMLTSAQKKFRNHPNIEFCQNDILKVGSIYPKKFDLALLLWTTLSAFNFIEQQTLLHSAYRALIKGGYLTIDICTGNNKQSFHNSLFFKACYQSFTHHGLMPQSKNLETFATLSNFNIIETIVYSRTKFGERKLVVLQKQSG